MKRPITLLTCAAAIAVATLWLATDVLTPPAPQFGHALFGSNDSAESAPIRLDFIVLGQEIYIDDNGDGTAQSSELTNSSPSLGIDSANGKLRYRLTATRLKLNPTNVTQSLPQQLIADVDVLDPDDSAKVLFRQTGAITLAERSDSSAWAHFDGPLSFRFVDEFLSLPVEGKPTVDLRVILGTHPYAKKETSAIQPVAFVQDCETKDCEPKSDCGTDCPCADGDSACQAGQSNLTQVLPGTVVPVATVEFPSSTENGTIKVDYDLDHFC